MIDLTDAASVVFLADCVHPQLLGSTVLGKNWGRNSID